MCVYTVINLLLAAFLSLTVPIYIGNVTIHAIGSNKTQFGRPVNSLILLSKTLSEHVLGEFYSNKLSYCKDIRNAEHLGTGHTSKNVSWNGLTKWKSCEILTYSAFQDGSICRSLKYPSLSSVRTLKRFKFNGWNAIKNIYLTVLTKCVYCIALLLVGFNALFSVKITNVEIRVQQRKTYSKSNWDFIFKLYNPSEANAVCYPSSFHRYCDEVVKSKGKSRQLMHFEWARFRSFQSFPKSSNVSPIRLARDGFYYTGHGDTVSCFSCGALASSLDKDGTIREIHRQLAPTCDFINGRHTKNDSIEDTRNDSFVNQNANHENGFAIAEDFENQRTGDVTASDLNYKQAANGYSISYEIPSVTHSNIETNRRIHNSGNSHQQAACGGTHNSDNYQQAANGGPQNSDNHQQAPKGGPQISENHESTRTEYESIGVQEVASEPRSETETSTKQQIESRNYGLETGVRDTTVTRPATSGGARNKARYPDYAKTEIREASFINWPLDFLEPFVLAACGLFYTGEEDRTRCFQCGGGLRNWDPEDDPWREHARWFPQCDHIRHVRGQDFINACLRNDTSNEKGVLEKENDGETDKTRAREVVNANTETEPKLHNELETAAAITTPEGAHNDFSQDETRPPTNTRLPSSSKNKGLSEIDKKSLAEENRQLREQMMCKICMDRDATVVFLPCGHMVSCDQCARALRKCAVCRKYIRSTVRAF